MAEILETLMLIVFSAGWYCSIGKMIRTKKASGKSISFVGMVCFGYLCGVLAKIAFFQETGELSAVVYLYAWNCLVTAFDGWLVIVLNHREKRLAAAAQPQNGGCFARGDAPNHARAG
jgi:uncharacterized membrane protein